MTEKLIDLLKAASIKRRIRVVVLGIDCYALPLTMAGFMKAAAKHPDSRAMFNAETLVTNLVDETGKPVFSSDDKEALAGEIAGDLLSPAVNAIHGLGVEEQVKN